MYKAIVEIICIIKILQNALLCCKRLICTLAHKQENRYPNPNQTLNLAQAVTLATYYLFICTLAHKQENRYPNPNQTLNLAQAVTLALNLT